jgi:hypothetical protein
MQAKDIMTVNVISVSEDTPVHEIVSLLLTRCFEDGRLSLDNNPAERALRGVAIGRKNYLFAGSDAGGRRAAAMYSLIETAKLNGINPQAYLADVLARIADHPAKRVADLLPWNWQPANPIGAAA